MSMDDLRKRLLDLGWTTELVESAVAAELRTREKQGQAQRDRYENPGEKEKVSQRMLRMRDEYSQLAQDRWQDTEFKVSQSGENHPDWKGDEASYFTIHQWVRDNYGVPDKCERCGRKGPVDAHNVPKTYRRVRSDWVFVCRDCHLVIDPSFERTPGGNWKRK